MNQILSTSMPMNDKKKRNKSKKTRNTQPVAIGSVVKFFAIAILAFGIFIVGTGVYAIYKNQSGQVEQNLKPTIAFENKNENTILLKITHKKNISEVQYGWNQENKKVVSGNGGKYIEQEISIPSGINTLYVLVKDEDGQEMPYEKQYQLESDITFEVSGNKIKIIYDGNKNVSYMTYKWNDEDETKIDINNTSIEEEIEAIKGLNTLTVVVVDEDNNKDTKVQQIKGISKPKLEIDYDDQRSHFVIRTSDDEKLKKIEFRLDQDDNQTYELNLEDRDLNEVEYALQRMPFHSGENIIEVTVYNSNGISESKGAKFIKQ